MRRMHETDEPYPRKPPTIKERPYPPTPDEYEKGVKKFRIMPKQRKELGLTWVEREWN